MYLTSNIPVPTLGTLPRMIWEEGLLPYSTSRCMVESQRNLRVVSKVILRKAEGWS